MGRTRVEDSIDVTEFSHLCKARIPIKDLSSRYDVTEQTIKNWRHKFGLTRPIRRERSEERTFPVRHYRRPGNKIPSRCPKCGGWPNTRTGYPVPILWSCVNCGQTSESVA